MNARAMVAGIVVTAILGSGVAFAQSTDTRTVAKLKDPEGTVLVSQGDAMAAGAKDQRLRPGTRVVTTAGARVIISYDKGCDVRLEENKRFTVRELGECAALIASVESVGVGGGVAAGGGLSTLALLGGAAVIGGIGYAIEENRRHHRHVSPD